ncbi:hypothetical protein [Methylobacterium isbiliense]|jgi:hypothetical protein|uniref:Head-to-tail stopper n=1 Tax=Methylobacterium isbiliense TaxID=315478 RepID=A0ABQ4SBH6_9HYPH|nr:hypothetical protein [Methylobacterium isbiliense]MDN3622599.1 hypothetical protein [Methylobacterium isbiliense]GJE00552.1 hypothetical protein GMJLKIPL_2475 [Methylobacterium isbiliense]
MPSPLAGSLAKTIAKALSPAMLPVTLHRDGAATGPAYDPSIGAPQAYPCRGFRDEWSAYSRQGGLVAARDWKVVILARTLAVEPQEGDRVTIQGVTLQVYSDGEGQPAVTSDPATATWELRCRL